MTILVLLLQASFVMGAALVAERLMASRASAATRHLLWTLATVALLLLPVTGAVLPRWTAVSIAPGATGAPLPIAAGEASPVSLFTPGSVRTPAARLESAAELATAPLPEVAQVTEAPTASMTFTGSTASTGFPWWSLVPFAYGLGVVLLLGRLWMHHHSAWTAVGRALPVEDPEWQTLLSACASSVGVRRVPRLVRSEVLPMPMTIGTRVPVIVIPAIADAWSEERRRAVLLHEIAHVARRDCLWQLLGEISCALYWVHPGAWWAARRLRDERELACDDFVVGLGERAADYATHLLEIARAIGSPRASLLAVTMAGSRRLEARLLCLMDHARNRTRPSARVRGGAIVVAFLVILCVGTATVTTQSGSAQVVGAAVQQDAAASTGGNSWSELGQRAMATLSARAQQLLESVAEGLALRDELDTQGYARPSVTELVELRQRGVTISYVRDLATLGYRLKQASVLIDFVDHGITGDFIRALTARGLSDLSPEQLMDASRNGILPSYVDGMAQLGFTPLSLDELIDAQRHGVAPPYISELRRIGYSWSLPDLIRAQGHGVDAEFVQSFRSMGYDRLTLDEAITLSRYGIDAKRASEANTKAGERLNIERLVQAVARGWKT